MLARALLHPHLADAVVDAGGLNNPWTLFERQRQRLFHIDIFARVERIDGALGMPVIGSGDQHHIEIFHLEQLAMIAETFGVGG